VSAAPPNYSRIHFAFAFEKKTTEGGEHLITKMDTHAGETSAKAAIAPARVSICQSQTQFVIAQTSSVIPELQNSIQGNSRRRESLLSLPLKRKQRKAVNAL
jgi:hypothetical protein